jgi:hypothetical protein
MSWKVQYLFWSAVRFKLDEQSGDLDDVTIQDVLPYPGSSTQTVFANQKEAKMGTLNNVTK